ncbi:MAG TPA: hypothetical protein VGH23_17275 [Rhizomicrobium sp.]|jgi:hypothetical protein
MDCQPTPSMLSEDLLTRLGEASHVRSFNEKLFDVAAGGDLAGRLQSVMRAVRDADVDALLRSQTSANRFLGADVEARMAFAVTRKKAIDSLSESRRAAKATAGLLQVLEDARAGVLADERHLADIAAKADEIASRLTAPKTAEELELQDRFNRRRANLLSLRASTALTLAQIPIAIAHNRALLERFNDVETVLFPLWERHAMALIQSPRDDTALGALRMAAKALMDRLSEISRLPEPAGKAA